MGHLFNPDPKPGSIANAKVNTIRAKPFSIIMPL